MMTNSSIALSTSVSPSSIGSSMLSFYNKQVSKLNNSALVSKYNAEYAKILVILENIKNYMDSLGISFNYSATSSISHSTPLPKTLPTTPSLVNINSTISIIETSLSSFSVEMNVAASAVADNLNTISYALYGSGDGGEGGDRPADIVSKAKEEVAERTKEMPQEVVNAAVEEASEETANAMAEMEEEIKSTEGGEVLSPENTPSSPDTTDYSSGPGGRTDWSYTEGETPRELEDYQNALDNYNQAKSELEDAINAAAQAAREYEKADETVGWAARSFESAADQADALAGVSPPAGGETMGDLPAGTHTVGGVEVEITHNPDGTTTVTTTSSRGSSSETYSSNKNYGEAKEEADAKADGAYQYYQDTVDERGKAAEEMYEKGTAEHDAAVKAQEAEKEYNEAKDTYDNYKAEQAEKENAEEITIGDNVEIDKSDVLGD